MAANEASAHIAAAKPTRRRSCAFVMQSYTVNKVVSLRLKAVENARSGLIFMRSDLGCTAENVFARTSQCNGGSKTAYAHIPLHVVVVRRSAPSLGGRSSNKKRNRY